MVDTVNPVRPKEITVDRAANALRSLGWMGMAAPTPCVGSAPTALAPPVAKNNSASALNTNELKLMSGPLPSAEIVAAELVGHYAVRFTWADGHSTGIYAFSALRTSCPCLECNPDRRRCWRMTRD